MLKKILLMLIITCCAEGLYNHYINDCRLRGDIIVAIEWGYLWWYGEKSLPRARIIRPPWYYNKWCVLLALTINSVWHCHNYSHLDMRRSNKISWLLTIYIVITLWPIGEICELYRVITYDPIIRFLRIATPNLREIITIKWCTMKCLAHDEV